MNVDTGTPAAAAARSIGPSSPRLNLTDTTDRTSALTWGRCSSSHASGSSRCSYASSASSASSASVRPSPDRVWSSVLPGVDRDGGTRGRSIDKGHGQPTPRRRTPGRNVRGRPTRLVAAEGRVPVQQHVLDLSGGRPASSVLGGGGPSRSPGNSSAAREPITSSSYAIALLPITVLSVGAGAGGPQPN
jgi:hypothetical protein